MGKKRKKQLRKNEAVSYPFVFDYRGRGPFDMLDLPKGKRLILELGCGIGAYTNALAEMNPNNLYIGVDAKADRIWRGAQDKEAKNLENVLFIVGDISYISEWFPKKSISEMWITFPDPQPRKKYAKKRLTSPNFLAKYAELLADGGCIHLKTDDEALYLYSLEVAQDEGWKIEQAMANMYADKKLPESLEIKTRFEEKWLAMGKEIFYLRITKKNG